MWAHTEPWFGGENSSPPIARDEFALSAGARVRAAARTNWPSAGDADRGQHRQAPQGVPTLTRSARGRPRPAPGGPGQGGDALRCLPVLAAICVARAGPVRPRSRPDAGPGRQGELVPGDRRRAVLTAEPGLCVRPHSLDLCDARRRVDVRSDRLREGPLPVKGSAIRDDEARGHEHLRRILVSDKLVGKRDR